MAIDTEIGTPTHKPTEAELLASIDAAEAALATPPDTVSSKPIDMVKGADGRFKRIHSPHIKFPKIDIKSPFNRKPEATAEAAGTTTADGSRYGSGPALFSDSSAYKAAETYSHEGRPADTDPSSILPESTSAAEKDAWLASIAKKVGPAIAKGLLESGKNAVDIRQFVTGSWSWRMGWGFGLAETATVVVASVSVPGAGPAAKWVKGGLNFAAIQGANYFINRGYQGEITKANANLTDEDLAKRIKELESKHLLSAKHVKDFSRGMAAANMQFQIAELLSGGALSSAIELGVKGLQGGGLSSAIEHGVKSLHDTITNAGPPSLDAQVASNIHSIPIDGDKLSTHDNIIVSTDRTKFMIVHPDRTSSQHSISILNNSFKPNPDGSINLPDGDVIVKAGDHYTVVDHASVAGTPVTTPDTASPANSPTIPQTPETPSAAATQPAVAAASPIPTTETATPTGITTLNISYDGDHLGPGDVIHVNPAGTLTVTHPDGSIAVHAGNNLPEYSIGNPDGSLILSNGDRIVHSQVANQWNVLPPSPASAPTSLPYTTGGFEPTVPTSEAASILNSPDIIHNNSALVGAHIQDTASITKDFLQTEHLNSFDIPQSTYEATRVAVQHNMEDLVNQSAKEAAAQFPNNPQAIAEHTKSIFESHLNSADTHKQLVETAHQAYTHQADISTALRDHVAKAIEQQGPHGVTEVVINHGDNVGKMLVDHGYSLTWGAADADILGAHIAANHDLLLHQWSEMAQSGNLPEGFHYPASMSEISDLVEKAQNGDPVALQQLKDSLHWIPANKSFKILNKSSISAVLAAIKK